VTRLPWRGDHDAIGCHWMPVFASSSTCALLRHAHLRSHLRFSSPVFHGSWQCYRCRGKCSNLHWTNGLVRKAWDPILSSLSATDRVRHYIAYIWPNSFPGKGSILVTVRCSMDCFARRALVSLLKSAETDSQLKLYNGSAALAG
jgi:hypothetical protein